MLIRSLQAGGKVEAVIEAAPAVDGYSVHANKLKRQGVKILTSHTEKRVLGESSVEKVKMAEDLMSIFRSLKEQKSCWMRIRSAWQSV